MSCSGRQSIRVSGTVDPSDEIVGQFSTKDAVELPISIDFENDDGLMVANELFDHGWEGQWTNSALTDLSSNLILKDIIDFLNRILHRTEVNDADFFLCFFSQYRLRKPSSRIVHLSLESHHQSLIHFGLLRIDSIFIVPGPTIEDRVQSRAR